MCVFQAYIYVFVAQIYTAIVLNRLGGVNHFNFFLLNGGTLAK